MNPNECVLICISFTYVIESIDSKLISVCLFNDYSLIADLHTFVYGPAECASNLLECIKVKLLTLNNFGIVIVLTNFPPFLHIKGKKSGRATCICLITK